MHIEKIKNKILLFDFDGVIVDTFDICYTSMKTVIANPPDEEGYRNWFNGNIYDNEERKIKSTKIDDRDAYFSSYTPLLMKLEPVAGIIDALKELNEKYRMLIVSSTISSSINSYFGKHNLSHYFEKIYGADIHKSKVNKINMIFSEFNIDQNDCVFISDTLGDMREASKVGVRSIGVSWGFHKRQVLQQGDPIAIVDSTKELVEYLGKME